MVVICRYIFLMICGWIFLNVFDWDSLVAFESSFSSYFRMYFSSYLRVLFCCCCCCHSRIYLLGCSSWSTIISCLHCDSLVWCGYCWWVEWPVTYRGSCRRGGGQRRGGGIPSEREIRWFWNVSLCAKQSKSWTLQATDDDAWL